MILLANRPVSFQANWTYDDILLSGAPWGVNNLKTGWVISMKNGWVISLKIRASKWLISLKIHITITEKDGIVMMDLKSINQEYQSWVVTL